MLCYAGAVLYQLSYQANVSFRDSNMPFSERKHVHTFLKPEIERLTSCQVVLWPF